MTVVLKRSALVTVVCCVLCMLLYMSSLTDTLHRSHQYDYSYTYAFIYEGLGYLNVTGRVVHTPWNEGLVSLQPSAVPVNCSKVIAGDEREIERVNRTMSRWKNSISDKGMLLKVKNCSWLREYIDNNFYNSELEKSFPIAFTFVVHDSPQQVLRLLRLLYRPQNSYCIHCDIKSKHKAFFQSIADCVDNIIVPSKLEDVRWGHYSILGAQMNCMNDLLQLRTEQSNKWQYLLNLCGKELPLSTNREMVQRLMVLNGSSNIVAYKSDGHSVQVRIKYRAKYNKQKMATFPDYGSPLGKPPFQIDQYYKSQTYVALSFQFTHFLTTNHTAIQVHNFFKDCMNPEEHFYATMFMMPGVPGGYRDDMRYFWMESAFWMDGRHGNACHGLVVHDICIVNVGDLSRVVPMGSSHLFHNKYFMEYDHVVMWCVEWSIAHRNRQEYHMEHAHNMSDSM